MAIPKVGTNVRGSRTGRPIMVVLDLLGRRGALRVLWELRGEPLTFRALQEACDTSPSLLNTRLTELRASNLVDHSEGGYHLTTSGRSLCVAMQPLSAWASAWAAAEERRVGKPAQPRRDSTRKSSKSRAVE